MSKAEFWKEYGEKLKTINEGMVFCRQHDKIQFFKLENGTLSNEVMEAISIERLEELRVFNKIYELLIMKTGKGFQSRWKDDKEIDMNSYKDYDNILWGTNAQEKNGYTRLFEERGMELLLPGSFTCGLKEKERVYLTVRNYIDYNELDQAYYNDARFVSIYNKK